MNQAGNMLMTRLEANAEVPRWEIVMECLLYEEKKIKQKEGNSNKTKAMTTHHMSTTKITAEVFSVRKIWTLEMLLS